MARRIERTHLDGDGAGRAVLRNEAARCEGAGTVGIDPHVGGIEQPGEVGATHFSVDVGERVSLPEPGRQDADFDRRQTLCADQQHVGSVRGEREPGNGPGEHSRTVEHLQPTVPIPRRCVAKSLDGDQRQVVGRSRAGARPTAPSCGAWQRSCRRRSTVARERTDRVGGLPAARIRGSARQPKRATTPAAWWGKLQWNWM